MAGELSFEAEIQKTGWMRAIAQMRGELQGFTGDVQREGSKIDAVYSRMAAGAAAYLSISAMTRLVTQLVTVRGQVQQLEVAFETMLKSKEAATKLMAQLVEVAARTPFSLESVSQGAKQLLAYGSTAESVVGELTMLGNVASGVSAPLGDLVYLYGTLRSQGRAYAVDIRQFAGRGIPIYQELAKVLGVGKEEIAGLIEAGKVGFPEVEKAFKSMTGASGQFFNLMEKQSQTLTGQISNLQDQIYQMFNSIGEANEGLLSKGISSLAFLVEHYKEIGTALGILVGAYGTYRAALALTIIMQGITERLELQNALAKMAGVAATNKATVATLLQMKAQAALNAVMAINPYVLLVTSIGALAAAFYFLNDSTTAAERAQKAFNDTMAENKKQIDDLRSSTNELLSIINDETQTKAAQIIAYEQLQRLYGDRLNSLSLEEFQLKATTEQQKLFNRELENISVGKLQEDLDNAIKKAENLSTKLISVGSSVGGGGESLVVDNTQSDAYRQAADEVERLKNELFEVEYAQDRANLTSDDLVRKYQAQLDALSPQIAEWEKVYGKLKKAEDGSYELQKGFDLLQINGILWQVNSLIVMLNKAKAAATGVAEDGLLSIDQVTKQIQTKTDDRNAATDQATRDKLNKEIKDLQTKKNQMEGKEDRSAISASNKREKAANKAAEDRLRFLEQLTDAETKFTISQKIEGDKQVAEIAEKYRKMREEAKKAGIKDAGVFQRIDTLETKERGESQTETETKKVVENLALLRERYREYEEFKTAFGEAEARKRFEGEVSYISQIEEELQKAKALPQTAAVQERVKQLTEALQTEQRRQFSEQNDWQIRAVADYASYSEKKLAIERRFATEIENANKTGQTSLIAGINKAKEQELRDLDESNAEILLATNRFFDGMVLTTQQQVQAQVENIRELLDSGILTGSQRADLEKQLEQYKDLLSGSVDNFEIEAFSSQLEKVNEDIAKIENGAPLAGETLEQLYSQRAELRLRLADAAVDKLNKKIQAMQGLGSSVSQLGGVLSSWGEESDTITQLGNALQGLGNSMGDITTLMEGFKKGGKFSGDGAAGFSDYAAAGQAIIMMISGIISAAKQRKEKLEEFNNAVLSQQHAYNLALLEEVRLRHEITNSPFFESYSAKVQSGLEAEIAIVKEYNQALIDLQSATVKTGTMKKKDWEKVATYTAAGAIAGTVIPGIGNAVGAVIGGVVGFVSGLFSSKRVDIYGNLLTTYKDLVDADGNLNKQRADALLQSGLLNSESKQQLQYVRDLADAYEDAKAQIDEVISDLAGGLSGDIINSLVENYKQGGEDAGNAFMNGFKPTLANIAKNLLFDALFSADLVKLTDQIRNSFKTSGTQDLARIIAEWGNTMRPAAEAYGEGLKEFEEMFASLGYDDIFGSVSKAKDQLTGQVQTVTENTASIVAGYLNVLRINSAESVSVIRQILVVMQVVADNTAYNKHLEAIDKNIADMKGAFSQRQFGTI